MAQVYQIHWDSNDAPFNIGEGMIVSDIREWEERVIDYVASHANKFKRYYDEANEFGEFPTIQSWAKWCIFNFVYSSKIIIDDYDKYFA